MTPKEKKKRKKTPSQAVRVLPREFEPEMEPIPGHPTPPKKTVLITGHKGQLGQALMELLQPHYCLAGVDIDEMDITKVEEVASTFYLHHPDIVIHTAAWTDVDGCELDPAKAIRVNALGTQNLVIAAEEFNSLFVYLSTDYVFSGDSNRPYLECDTPAPLSWYGKSKYMGEEFVRNMLFRYFIIRTSWLIGEKGRNFVKAILKQADEKKELRVVNDQRGCPTFASDLARAIAELIETPYYGTYHITNTGETTWYDFAVKIIKEAGRDVTVIPITSAELGRPAPRPAYSVLSNLLFKERGFTPLPPWEESLVEYLIKIGEKPPKT